MFFPLFLNYFCLFFSLIFNRFYLFFKAFPKGKYVSLVSSIILLWSDYNISLSVRNSYLSFFSGCCIFAASQLITYCNFSSLMLSSIVTISFYILSTRFFLKRKLLLDKIVVSITKQEYVFIKIHKILNFDIWRMIKRKLLKLFGIVITK